MRLSSHFLGSASIIPVQEVTAGSLGTWKIIYTVGKYGIDDTGEILIVQRDCSDWELPQFEYPSRTGYTTVETTGSARFSLHSTSIGFVRPWRNCFGIRVYDGFLKEGDQVIVCFGDREKGSPGMKAQSFAETQHLFKMLVDPFGTGHYKELRRHPRVPVVAGPAAEIKIVLPSTLSVGESFPVTITVLDNWGNPTPDFEGRVILHTSSPIAGLPKTLIFSKEDSGFKKVSNLSALREGTIRVSAEIPGRSLKAVSNASICSEEKDLQLFWGDLHGQTEITVGTGTLEEYFAFARGPAALDFCSWQGNDFQITAADWEAVKKTVKEYNGKENFVTFLGYEWSGLTPGGGDHNIYYLHDEGPLLRSSQWLVHGGKEDSESDKYPISELWEAFSGRDDVLAVAHVGGRYANFDFFDPNFVQLIEVHSHHGTFEWFIQDALARGLRVGFLAGSDDHSGRPGLSYPTQRSAEGASFDVKSGYVAVYAERLSRESIWDALKKRRCYGSTCRGILLDVKIDTHCMGEEIECSTYPTIKIKAIGGTLLQRITLKRGNKTIYTYPSYPSFPKQGRMKLRIYWSGVRVKTRLKKTVWDGSLFVRKGRIISAKEFAFDRSDEGIRECSNQYVSWNSSTSGDMDGIIMEIDAGEETEIHFHSKQLRFNLPLKKIEKERMVYKAGGVNQIVCISLLEEELKDEVSLSFCDKHIQKGINPYWVKVEQDDGHRAWSSPIYVHY